MAAAVRLSGLGTHWLLGFAAGLALTIGPSLPVGAQNIPGACSTPVAHRTRDVGCYVDAITELGVLPHVPLFWHLYKYPTLAAAGAAKVARGTVVEAFDKVWVYTIAEKGWHPVSGDRVAIIGPLPLATDKRYTARYLEAVFKPGMRARTHRHSGPEAFFLLSGTQCLESPEGITISRAGGSAIIRQGLPMTLKSVGAETRRSVVLVLHDTSQPWQTLTSEWTPKNLCP